MNDEIELVYNTRSRKKRFDTDFHARLATALNNDISVEISDDEDDDALEDDDNDQGDDNLRNDNASDIEDELIIEPNEILDSDEDEEESEEESEERIGNRSKNDDCFYGKDGTKWSKN